MAGNTKLTGFGADGMVVLERWGGEAHVEVSKDSLKALRQACHQGLPKKPPPHLARSLDANYNYQTGDVNIRLHASQASELILELNEAGLSSSVAAELVPLLEHSVEAHTTYMNAEDEPGVEAQP